MRFKDRDWSLPESISWDQVPVALLMDIRDELQGIRAALHPLRHLECRNFLHIPRKLDAIRLNTARKKRKSVSKSTTT